MRTIFLHGFLVALLALLSACGGQPSKPQADTVSSTRADQIQELLSQAENSTSPQREALQLQAAGLLLSAKQSFLASQILDDIDPLPLPLEIFASYSEMLARLKLARGHFEEAQLALESPRIMENLAQLSQAQQLDLTVLRAEIYARLGNHIASAQQRIYIDGQLQGERQQNNRSAIWRSLMQVPLEALEKYQTNPFSPEYVGWIELAYIARENQGDLDQQVKQLEQWQLQRPLHPANQDLPGGLELIQELAANRPQKVALLLPLTGRLAPFGKAVRDGFIAARYQTQQNGGQVPTLKIYNTEDHPIFLELYQRAVDEGAELIVGPLEKHRLQELFSKLTLEVPTLALNRGEDFGLPPINLYQFGLAPQDEAAQIADIAYLENHQRAMVISPVGEWGDKVSSAFINQWQELGGDVATLSQYSGQKDYSNSIKDALLLQESEGRAKRLQQIIGESVEFTPRRREDIDMVFLLARPQQARSLKPLLAYHYAGDLPVYGTSRLYTGYDDPSRDGDINGVRFNDMPWILNAPNSLHQQISTEISQSKAYQRMYALGVDSFQLHPRLRQLEEIPNSRVYGQTGALKLNAFNAIERELLYAQFRQGKARQIPIADRTLTEVAPREGYQNEETTQRQY